MWMKSRQERATDLALAWVQTIKLWVELRELTGTLTEEDRSFVETQLTRSTDVMLGKDTAGLTGFKSMRERAIQKVLKRLRLAKAFLDVSPELTGEAVHDRQWLKTELDEAVKQFGNIA